MFTPRGISLDRLLEIHQEQHRRGEISRSAAMSRRAMREGTAEHLSRYEQAIERVLQVVIHLERTNPTALADAAKATSPTPTKPAPPAKD